MSHPRTVLIDFDGVLHSYTSGWQGKSNIPDAPNPGAIDFLRDLIAHPRIEPIIWTSRVHVGTALHEATEASNARVAICEWLLTHGLTREEVDQLKITNDKPPAVLIIDDRAFKFEGLFPSVEFIEDFQPWTAEDVPVVPEELGATGEYPEGQLNEDDEGALRISLHNEENRATVISFGKKVRWIGFDRKSGLEFVEALKTRLEKLP